MTTIIACRPLQMMVADSRISHGDGKFTSRKKVAKVGKYLAGVAGAYAPALTYLRKFSNAAREMDGKTVPQLDPIEGEFELMVLSEHGLWIYGEDGSSIEVEEDFYAIGSGSSWASACLRTQELTFTEYNLEMAMDVACEFDNDSGLPQVEISLKPMRARKQDSN